MQSARLLHLRHHLRDPRGLSLRVWAREREAIEANREFLLRSELKYRQKRLLSRELCSIRATAPELQGPDLASAVLERDRLLRAVENACHAELHAHVELLGRFRRVLTPQRLLHLAHAELGSRHQQWTRGIDGANQALDRLIGEAPPNAMQQCQAHLQRVRKVWCDMHDTLLGLLLLVDGLHDHTLAPFVHTWVDQCLDVLHESYLAVLSLEDRFSLHLQVREGK